MARGIFGERLKRERDLREVSMDELSKSTRISSRFLQALENEDWETLPGGVFGHGFVRSIARYLGLDEEALLSEYDLARTETLPLPPPKPEERIPSPSKWIPVVAVLVIVLLFVGIFFTGRYGWRRYRAHRAAKQSAAPAAVSPSTPAAKQSAAPVAVSPSTPTAKQSAAPVTVSPSTPAAKQSAAPVTVSPSTPNTGPAPPQPSAETHANVPLELTISTSAATRVRVVADDRLLIDRHLPADEIRHFTAKQRFDVSVSNASAVLLELNGKAMPPIGAPGASGRMVYTQADLR